MTREKVQLRGWKAIAVLALFAAFALFRLSQQSRTLDTQGREVLATWLAAEYTRAGLKTVGPSGPSVADTKALLDAQAIEFPSLSARGRGENIIVRAEVMVAGGTPPDGRSIRYFRMSYRLPTGWTYQRDATAFAYYVRLF